MVAYRLVINTKALKGIKPQRVIQIWKRVDFDPIGSGVKKICDLK